MPAVTEEQIMKQLLQRTQYINVVNNTDININNYISIKGTAKHYRHHHFRLQT